MTRATTQPTWWLDFVEPEHADPPYETASSSARRKPSWTYVAGRSFREFIRDECPDLAAALTYYSVLALFPAAIAMVSLVGFAGESRTAVDTLLGVLDDIGARSTADALKPGLDTLSETSGAGLALVGGLGMTLWSASRYVGAFGRAMNRIYHIHEGRPAWKLRPLVVLVTLVTVLLTAVVAIGLVLSGPVAESVGSAVGLGPAAVLAWRYVKWPVLLCAVALAVGLLYHATPNVRHPRFRWLSGGALVAIVVWAAGSVAFGLYVTEIAAHHKTYGSLAGVVVLLLWIWSTNLALLFGAELDVELERSRELQVGIPAEEVVQLPPRDTRKILRTARKRGRDVEVGRRLRTGDESASPRMHRCNDFAASGGSSP